MALVHIPEGTARQIDQPSQRFGVELHFEATSARTEFERCDAAAEHLAGHRTTIPNTDPRTDRHTLQHCEHLVPIAAVLAPNCRTIRACIDEVARFQRIYDQAWSMTLDPAESADIIRRAVTKLDD
jgi:hypothetical protein